MTNQSHTELAAHMKLVNEAVSLASYHGMGALVVQKQIEAIEASAAALESPERVPQHARDAVTWTAETGYVFAPTQSTAPAQNAPWKDHDTSMLVNELRDIAVKYRDAQQLRGHISYAIKPLADRLAALRARLETPMQAEQQSERGDCAVCTLGISGTCYCGPKPLPDEFWNLVENLRCQRTGDPIDSAHTKLEQYVNDLIHRAALSHPSTPQGWISVDEQLPPKNTEVLIAFAESRLASTGQHTGSVRDHNGWCYPKENELWPGETSDFPDGCWPTVRYWQPLPPPPEQGGKG